MTPHKPVVGIVGLGTVGRALLDMLWDTGHEVIGVNSDPAALARLNGRPTADGSAPVRLVAEIAQMGRADLVIEAVSEDEAVKSEVLHRLHTLCADGNPWSPPRPRCHCPGWRSPPAAPRTRWGCAS